MGEGVKTCMKCGIDCTDDRRYKDADGLYTCGACYDALKAGAEHRAALKAKYKSKAKAAEPALTGEEIPLDASPEDLEAHGTRACPGCGRSMPVDHLVCQHCQYNMSTGKRPWELEKDRECAQCGYNLKGLALESRCPECGTISVGGGTTPRTRAMQQATRDYYLRPVKYIAAGLIALVLVRMAANQPKALVVDLIASFGVVPLALVGYVIFSKMWSEEAEQPLPLAALSLAAVFCATSAIDAVVSYLQVPALGWAIGLLVYYGLLMHLFELEDWRDAVVFSVIIRVTYLFAFLGLVFVANKYLGWKL